MSCFIFMISSLYNPSRYWLFIDWTGYGHSNTTHAHISDLHEDVNIQNMTIFKITVPR